jgi:hypothetical protein
MGASLISETFDLATGDILHEHKGLTWVIWGELAAIALIVFFIGFAMRIFLCRFRASIVRRGFPVEIRESDRSHTP